MLRHSAVALLCAATAGGWTLGSSPAAHSAGCGPGGYSYAGLAGAHGVHGISATVTAETLPRVADGHVAAWIGVGGEGFAPGGSDEWLQARLAGFDDGRNELYYEVAQPGMPTRSFRLGGVDPQVGYGLSVLEVRGHPGWWRVWLDGHAVTGPIFLVGSHGRWSAVATGESWTGEAGVCNGFDYRFTDVAVAIAPGGCWRAISATYVVQNPGYRVRRLRSGFIATAK